MTPQAWLSFSAARDDLSQYTQAMSIGTDRSPRWHITRHLLEISASCRDIADCEMSYSVLGRQATNMYHGEFNPAERMPVQGAFGPQEAAACDVCGSRSNCNTPAAAQVVNQSGGGIRADAPETQQAAETQRVSPAPPGQEKSGSASGGTCPSAAESVSGGQAWSLVYAHAGKPPPLDPEKPSDTLAPSQTKQLQPVRNNPTSAAGAASAGALQLSEASPSSPSQAQAHQVSAVWRQEQPGWKRF